MASYNYGRYYDRGMRGRGERRSPQDEELDQRLLDANRRMEDSSSRCVQILNETIKKATDISEELELQAESLDRKYNLDTNLESSRRNLREVKSMFGSMVNHFTKPKISLADKMIRLLQSYILHLFSSSGVCVYQNNRRMHQYNRPMYPCSNVPIDLCTHVPMYR